MPAIALEGQRFGRLVVLRRAARTHTQATWFCQCDCGATATVLSELLRKERTRSCGCLRLELSAARGKTWRLRHGHARGRGTAEYRTWANMLSRCANKNHTLFPRYGARGIRVCERWQTFENFLADMGPRPAGLSLDRIDNNGNYEPANCRWATSIEQNRNTRNNRWVVVHGVRKPLREWLALAGVSRHLFYQRISRGLSEETALFMPLHHRQTHSS